MGEMAGAMGVGGWVSTQKLAGAGEDGKQKRWGGVACPELCLKRRLLLASV